MNIYQTTVRFNENDFYAPIVIACLCWDLIKLLMHDIKLSDQWSSTTGVKSSLSGIDNSTTSLSLSHSFNKSSELFLADVGKNRKRNNTEPN